MSLAEKLVAAAGRTRGAKRPLRRGRIKTYRSKLASESNTAVMCDDLSDWTTKVRARGLTMDASSVEGAILAVRGSPDVQEYFGVWNQAKAHGWVDNSGYATIEELFTRVEETAVTSYFTAGRYDAVQTGQTVRVFPKDPADWADMLEIYGGLADQASGIREVEDTGRVGIEFDLVGFDDGATLPPDPADATLSGAEGFAGGYGYPAEPSADPERVSSEGPGGDGPPIVIIVMCTESTHRGLRRGPGNVMEANMEDCIEVQSYTGWLAMVQGVGPDVEITGGENGATARIGKEELGAWNGEKGVFNPMVGVPEVGGDPWSEPDTRPGEPGKIDKKSGGYGRPVKEAQEGRVDIPVTLRLTVNAPQGADPEEIKSTLVAAILDQWNPERDYADADGDFSVVDGLAESSAGSAVKEAKVTKNADGSELQVKKEYEPGWYSCQVRWAGQEHWDSYDLSAEDIVSMGFPDPAGLAVKEAFNEDPAFRVTFVRKIVSTVYADSPEEARQTVQGMIDSGDASASEGELEFVDAVPVALDADGNPYESANPTGDFSASGSPGGRSRPTVVSSRDRLREAQATAAQTSTALTSARSGIQRFKDPEQARLAAIQHPDHVIVDNGTGTLMVMSAEDSKAFKDLGWKVKAAVTEKDQDRGSEFTANQGLDPANRSAAMAARGTGARRPGWYVVDGDRIVAGPFDNETKAMPSWKPGLKIKKLAGEATAPVAEGLRLVKSLKNGSKSAKVFHDTEWGEFRVKFYDGGEHQEDADYYADDEADAVGTARVQIGLSPAATTEARFETGATVMVPGRSLGKVVKVNWVERTVTVELKGGRRADFGYKELRKVRPDHQLPPVTRGDRATSHFTDARTKTEADSARELGRQGKFQVTAEYEPKTGDHVDYYDLTGAKRYGRVLRYDGKTITVRRTGVGADRSTASDTQTMRVVREAALRVTPEQLDSLWSEYVKAETGCKEAGDAVTRGQRMSSSRALNAFRRACQASNLDPVREVARRMTIPVPKREAANQGRSAPPKRSVPDITQENGVSKATALREGYEGPGWYVLNDNGDILSPQFDFESDAQTFHDEHLGGSPDAHVSRVDDAGEGFGESAPPGMEDEVKALKKKYPDEKAFAIAWAQYKKRKGEAGANYPSPEAYGRFGAGEGSVVSNPSGFARAKGSGEPAMEGGPVNKFVTDGGYDYYRTKAHIWMRRNSGSKHWEPANYVPDEVVAEWESKFSTPKSEGRKVQSKFAGVEVDLDRWYVVSDAARFLAPGSFATEEEARAWVAANPDGVDLEDGDAVMKGEEFVAIYDESYPAEPSQPSDQPRTEGDGVVLDLDHIQFDRDGERVVLANLDAAGIEKALNELLAGRPESFYQTPEWDELNDGIPGADAVRVAGVVYPVTVGPDTDDPDAAGFNWEVRLGEPAQPAVETPGLAEADDGEQTLEEFKGWLEANRERVVVGVVESDYGETWLVGSKETGWGFLDLLGYWSHETGPVFSEDLSPMDDTPIETILEPDQNIERSNVQELLDELAEAEE